MLKILLLFQNNFVASDEAEKEKTFYLNVMLILTTQFLFFCHILNHILGCWLVGFHGILTLVGYSVPDAVYIYDWLVNSLLVMLFLNEPELI